jgi:hypothetical protein
MSEHTDLHLVNMRDYLKKPLTWQEICELITMEAHSASLEQRDALLQLEAEMAFYKNIKGYCEQNIEDIKMIMADPNNYCR